jgi:hypothetical protein
MTALPKLYDYEADVEIVDLPANPGVPRVITRVYDDTTRMPAPPQLVVDRFPVTIGFTHGARTEIIADSIALGERWIIGPAPYSGPTAIWLTALELPYRDQVAAWRARGPRGLT